MPAGTPALPVAGDTVFIRTFPPKSFPVALELRRVGVGAPGPLVSSRAEAEAVFLFLFLFPIPASRFRIPDSEFEATSVESTGHYPYQKRK